MHNNADLIYKTYKNIETEKLQICRFEPTLRFLTTVVREKSSNTYKNFILPKQPCCRRKYMPYVSCNMARNGRSISPKIESPHGFHITVQYFAPFRLHGELRAENVANFPTTYQVAPTPSLGMFPQEVRGETYHEETTVVSLCYGEDHMIIT